MNPRLLNAALSVLLLTGTFALFFAYGILLAQVIP